MMHILSGTLIEMTRRSTANRYLRISPRPIGCYDFCLLDAAGERLRLSVKAKDFPACIGSRLLVLVDTGQGKTKVWGLYNRDSGRTMNYRFSQTAPWWRPHDPLLIGPMLLCVFGPWLDAACRGVILALGFIGICSAVALRVQLHKRQIAEVDHVLRVAKRIHRTWARRGSQS